MTTIGSRTEPWPPESADALLMADRQTVGGYPVIAHVARADRPKAAQLWPGDEVRFRGISVEEARGLAREQQAALEAAIPR